MIDTRLRMVLRRVVQRQQHVQLGWRLALSWLVMALVGLGLWYLKQNGLLLPPRALATLALVALCAVLVIARRLRRTEPDWRQLARRIEDRFPDLDGLLLTAVQQPVADHPPRPYLQERLLRAALERGAQSRWQKAIAPWRLVLAQAAHLAGLAAFAGALWLLHLPVPPPSLAALPRTVPTAAFSILPGDTRLERGSSLVVLARLGNTTPRQVDLVVRESGQPDLRLPMVRSLGDPLYGGRVAEVKQDFTYRVAYDGQSSRDFKVTVYEHPRLERADASLTYPDYTRQSPRQIKDTRRVSAVEGTSLEFQLQLNKPVASARLLPRDPAQPTLTLRSETNRPAATLGPLTLARSGVYSLALTDADGLTNKQAALFTLDVLPNRTPELRLTSPRGDLRPSALEEINFAGTAWDDFGVLAFGFAYALGSESPRFVELGTNVSAQEKRAFQQLLRFEPLGVQPEDLVTWFTWADDLGPTGQVRRTMGDLFFAEVRPFDEIFRESPDANSQPGEQPEGSGESPGNTPGNLAQLQKQILSATWRLQRDPQGTSPAALGTTNAPTPARTNAPATYRDNATVIRDAQIQALEQAEEALQEASDAQASVLWEAVTREMKEARKQLDAALNDPAALAQAVPREQAAYQALLRLQEREFAVTRNRNRSRSQSASSRNQSMQNQLDQLDLTRPESRYESQSQAQAPEGPERREQLQILNRLQELARRREDANEQLRELQTALQEARTETEREELRRRLQRLEEEQRQMLADADELQERMNRPENQSRTMDQSRQLDAARQELERAAEATAQGNPSQALAAGTRAERQLQELRDSARRESSSAFTEDLRQARTQAREVVRQEELLRQSIDNLADRQRPTLSDDAERDQALRPMEEQRQRVRDLTDRTAEISSQAEAAEPLVSRELYDTLRRFSQTEADTARRAQEELLERGLLTRRFYEQLNDPTNAFTRSLDLTTELLRQNQLPAAQQAESRARAGLDQLARGVERAAERVLGDDTEALRRAGQELDQLTRQLENEVASNASTPPAGAPPTDPAAQPDSNTPRGDSAAPGQSAIDRPAGTPAPGNPPSERGNSPAGSGNAQAGNRPSLDSLLGNANDGGASASGTGPLTGSEFSPWSDRLRDVEEMVEMPDLRNRVATARERARQFRQNYRRDLKKPDWAVVQLEVVGPLVEVRSLIAEELARRQPQDRLVPADREPIPARFTDRVRRYYEALGRDEQGPPTPQR